MKPTELKCYQQVVAVIGEALADHELQLVIDCEECGIDESAKDVFNSISWVDSPQKDSFWELIYREENPYDHGHEKPEVKEWVYCNTKDGEKWIDPESRMAGCGRTLATHKSVTMPDWVPDKKGFSVTIDPIDIMDDKPATKSESGGKERSDGSTASYYELPEGATELQHLIGHRNQNGQIAEIFRACYRYGLVSHSDMLRDAKKIKFYAQAEIERLEKLKVEK